MVDRQFSIQQVEIEPGDPRYRFQSIADQRFLGRTVHLVDTVAHPAGTFGRRVVFGKRLALAGFTPGGAARIGLRRLVVAVVVIVVMIVISVICGGVFLLVLMIMA